MARILIIAIIGSLLGPCDLISQGSCPDKACSETPNDLPDNSEIAFDAAWRLNQYKDFTITDTKLTNLLNKQINLEMQISYIYLSIANFFDRDDVALPGFHRLFKAYAVEEQGHAQGLIDYLNKRGVTVMYGSIKGPCEAQELLEVRNASPEMNTVQFSKCGSIATSVTRTLKAEIDGRHFHSCDWKSPLHAAVTIRQAELNNHKHLKQVHHYAHKINDPALLDFLDVFLKDQVEEIKELTDLITQLQRVENCLGYYIIDRDLQAAAKKTENH